MTSWKDGDFNWKAEAYRLETERKSLEAQPSALREALETILSHYATPSWIKDIARAALSAPVEPGKIPVRKVERKPFDYSEVLAQTDTPSAHEQALETVLLEAQALLSSVVGSAMGPTGERIADFNERVDALLTGSKP